MANNITNFVIESRIIVFGLLETLVNEKQELQNMGLYPQKGIPDAKGAAEPIIKVYKNLISIANESDGYIKLGNEFNRIEGIKNLEIDELLTTEQEIKEKNFYQKLFPEKLSTGNFKDYKKKSNLKQSLTNSIHELVVLMSKWAIIDENEALKYSGELGLVNEFYDRDKVYNLLKSKKLISKPQKVKGVPFAFDKSQLILFGGVGGVGKTDYVVNLIKEIKQLGGVDFFSLELNLEELKFRIAANEGLAKGELTKDINGLQEYNTIIENHEVVEKAFDAWKEAPVDILHSDDYRKLNAIIQHIEKSTNPYVVIDHIGAVHPNKSVGDWQDLDVVVKVLSALAKRRNKTIFAITTLNKNESKEFNQFNFSGGTSVRHEPHVLMGLLRHKEDPERIVLWVVKDRSGGSNGKYTLEYNRSTKKYGTLLKDDSALVKL